MRYGLPYLLQGIPGVILLAVVGLLDALRVLLFVPILGVVLNPQNSTQHLWLFGENTPQWLQIDLHNFVPSYFHNAWSVVAFALIVSTLIKGICD